MTKSDEPADTNNWILLRDLMDKHFNGEELKDICFKLSVDHGNLPGIIKRTRITELIKQMYRDGRIDDLLTLLAGDKPRIEWPTDLPDRDFKGIESRELDRWIYGLIIFGVVSALLMLFFLGVSAGSDLPETLTFLYDVGVLEKPAPTETPLPFTQAQNGEVLIVVATFYRSEGVIDTEPHIKIKRELEKQIAERKITGLRVESEPTALRIDDQETARSLVQKSS